MPKASNSAATASTETAADSAVKDQTTSADVVTADEVSQVGFTHTVRAMPARGFYRAGRFWPPEETKVIRAEFSDEQWKALEDEPALAIKSVEQ